MNIKRIIAREGLVIAEIFALGIICDVLSIAYLNLNKTMGGTYLYDFGQMFRGGAVFFVIVYPLFLLCRFLLVSVRKIMRNEIAIKKVIATEVLVFSISFIFWYLLWFIRYAVKYDPTDAMEMCAYNFLYIFTYSLITYAIIRFIIWAVRTLRSK